ncbi:MAG: hypothetical protein RPS47_07725 [Colwellia sp.]|jgi:hypothetical protein
MAATVREKLLDIKNRLCKLTLNMKITREEELSLIQHLEASQAYGAGEIESFYRMSNEELINPHGKL